MAITFDCECGESLEAEVRHCGRKVRCPTCSERAVVPFPPITFDCACGQSLTADNAHAGRRVTCRIYSLSEVTPTLLRREHA